MTKILKVRRDTEANIPDVLNLAEFGFATDTRKLFIGNGVDRTLINNYRNVSIVDKGAVGDGVTDDTTAILSAIAEAKASKSNVIIPPSQSGYVIKTPLFLTTGDPLLIWDNPDTFLLFDLPSNSDVAITIKGISQPFMGSIKTLNENYQSVGIKLIDCNFQKFYFQKNQYFEKGLIVISENNFVFDNDITFNLIDARQCIIIETTNSLYSLEGNFIKGNFITEFTHGVIVKKTSISKTILWNTIELNVMHGTQPGNIGFYFDGPSGEITSNNFRVLGYCSMELGAVNGTYIGGSNAGYAEISNTVFDLYVEPTAIDKDFFIRGDNEIKLRGDQIKPSAVSAGIALPIVSGQGGYNGGVASYTNKIVIEITVPDTVIGGLKVPYYFYHQLLGNDVFTAKSVKVIPLNSDIELFDIYAFDNSAVVTNEGIVAITAKASFGVETTLKFILEIG